ncbi:hypothetical protein [Methylomicrobium sp. Wu6]|uniref:hypothetical protein n=1 Tax=Methylomicrobium sp. Wu6 TaxID=3107928 RepID=UPI002DD645C9|nr:hypothetical protein [Methylomicrobium sp. Wu6]MEC4749874.1 hypothetical protein [Methylomicrobium sp. Wu6]
MPDLKPQPIPKNSLAHKMVRLNGWTKTDAIIEIAHFDKVDETEATRRYDLATQQMINRMVGQHRRHDRAKFAMDDARYLVLAIAYHDGTFICSKDLPRISYKAGWGSLVGTKSTGRVMKEIIFPMEKSGLITEERDADDKFIGYRLTDQGRATLLGEQY